MRSMIDKILRKAFLKRKKLIFSWFKGED